MSRSPLSTTRNESFEPKELAAPLTGGFDDGRDTVGTVCIGELLAEAGADAISELLSANTNPAVPNATDFMFTSDVLNKLTRQATGSNYLAVAAFREGKNGEGAIVVIRHATKFQPALWPSLLLTHCNLRRYVKARMRAIIAGRLPPRGLAGA
jgi:hypothetical protein